MACLNIVRIYIIILYYIYIYIQYSNSSSFYGWALFLVPVFGGVSGAGAAPPKHATTTDLSFKSHKTRPARVGKKHRTIQLSLHSKCLPCLRVKPWNDRTWSPCGTGRTCQRRSQRQGMAHFGWLQRHGKDWSGLKQHRTNYILLSRTLYLWVYEQVQVLYFWIVLIILSFWVRAFLSSGLSKLWKVQTVLGTVLVYLCLQVFCWIASLAVLMRTLASICFMYFHVPWPFICSRKISSDDPKDQPLTGCGWVHQMAFIVQKITNRVRLSCANCKSWCNYCCHAEWATACNPAVCCAAMQISNWKLRSEPKRRHDKCKFLSYKHFRFTQWMCLEKLFWQTWWNMKLPFRKQDTKNERSALWKSSWSTWSRRKRRVLVLAIKLQVYSADYELVLFLANCIK